MQPVSQQNEASYQFDAFELNPVRRVLLRDGKAVALKPKVFETLLVLVRNSGRVMDKDELMQQVWPDTVVEEVNLAHNISVLRKALGQKEEENRFIITVPGEVMVRRRGNGDSRNAPAPWRLLRVELTRSVWLWKKTVERDMPGRQMSVNGGKYPSLPAKPARASATSVFAAAWCSSDGDRRGPTDL